MATSGDILSADIPNKTLHHRVVFVHEPKDEYSDTTDAYFTSSSEDEDVRFDLRRGTNLSAEYWYIQKLLKYVMIGDVTATSAALGLIKDCDLSTEISQLAIRDMDGGLEVLVNLLEVEEHKCVSGSLKVLRDVSLDSRSRSQLIDLGLVSSLVELLAAQARDLRILAAQTIANVALHRKGSRFVRKAGGISKLLDLMDVSAEALVSPREALDDVLNEEVDAAASVACALRSLSASLRNVVRMRLGGVVPLLGRLLQAVHYDVVVPTVGVLAHCAREHKFRMAIEEEDIVPDLVEYLKEPDKEMVTNAARTIFECVVLEAVSRAVKEAGGVDQLVRLCKDTTAREDKALLGAVTGAIWRCAGGAWNLPRLEQLGTLQVMVALLTEETGDEVLAHCAGAVSEMCARQENTEVLRKSGGLPPLVNMLNGTNRLALVNACAALGKCANNLECMKEMEELDAVRLIWSLLKNPDQMVQTQAAWALCPCIQNADDSGEMVRSFVGGLELVVDLLSSTNEDVLAAVAAVTAHIMTGRENLAVLTDLGVVPLLVPLINTNNNLLRRHVAMALGNCCNWGTNCRELGILGAVGYLVEYIHSDDEEVRRATTYAIHNLTTDPHNCIHLHSKRVVPFLLKMIASPDVNVQYAAAGGLNNMRKLVLAAEKYKFSQ